MQEKLSIKEGDILYWLVWKREKSIKDLATALQMHPNSVPRLFKSEKLTDKVKKNAAAFFEVGVDVFEGIPLPMVPDLVQETSPPYGEKTNDELRREVGELKRQIAELVARDDLNKELVEIIKTLTREK